jgi:hypothetical protein
MMKLQQFNKIEPVMVQFARASFLIQSCRLRTTVFQDVLRQDTILRRFRSKQKIIVTR